MSPFYLFQLRYAFVFSQTKITIVTNNYYRLFASDFWDESNISQITRREHFKNPAELFVYLFLFFHSILVEILF